MGAPRYPICKNCKQPNQIHFFSPQSTLLKSMEKAHVARDGVRPMGFKLNARPNSYVASSAPL